MVEGWGALAALSGLRIKRLLLAAIGGYYCSVLPVARSKLAFASGRLMRSCCKLCPAPFTAAC